MTIPIQKKTPLNDAVERPRFYLIFDAVAKSDVGNLSDVTLEEIDEIEQVRRMVMDVGDERPIFMTTT